MPESDFIKVTLGLGGNIADPIKAMASALRSLDTRQDCRILAVSRVYRTPPWGKTDQAFFYNACAVLETVLEPAALLDVCLDIEQTMKRERTERWGPRTIDIDILTFGDMGIHNSRLQIPHPRLTERGFVLVPLAEIAADLFVEGRTVGEWLACVDVGGIEVADGRPNWWRV